MPDGTSNIEEQPTAASSPGASPKKARKIRIVKKVVEKKAPREQSSIAFPYGDLEIAIGVAQAVFDAGAVALTREQLAGVLGLSLGSGNFVLKTATVRTFGLLVNKEGKYELTELGFEAVNPDEKVRRSARAKAFLAVPLYQKAYEEFRGKPLPPRPHGLEQAFVKFGVAPKQRTAARLAFDKSAKQAGFFDNGMERLVAPIITGGMPTDRGRPSAASSDGEPDNKAKRVLRKIAHDEGDHHPFVQGLLDTLPEPGTNWAIEGRAKWLQAAAHIFDLIYGGDGAIRILAEKPTSTD
jgi:hypothetical protein